MAVMLPKQLYILTSGSCIRRLDIVGAVQVTECILSPPESNWDIWSPLAANEMENEDQVKLVAVLNTAHLVSERCHMVGVFIFTGSEYVFHGVRDWFPNWKGTGEQRGLRLKDIDRFHELDRILRLVKRLNLLKVEVRLLSWAENLTAYGLTKKGAEFSLASQLLQCHDSEGKRNDSTKYLEQRMLEISWQ